MPDRHPTLTPPSHLPGPLLSHLPLNHTYDFIDGSYLCPAFPGVDLLYPGPFLCYYTHHSPSAIQAALAALELIIAEDGPFDGVIAFSESLDVTTRRRGVLVTAVNPGYVPTEGFQATNRPSILTPT